MGNKSAYNVLDELAKSRTLVLSKFLHALGMERIGPEVAVTLSQHFIGITPLLQWAENGGNEEITSIEGIGEKVADIFRNGLLNRMELIRELSEIITITDELEASSGVFTGLTFCITGSHSKPRKEIGLAIKNAGGKVVSSVSGNLNILVAGEKAGSKLIKAEGLGIEIWNEEKLFSQLVAPDSPNVTSKTLFDYD